MNPFFAMILTFAAALGWIESRLSRKIIHIGTGPIFVMCWLLYADVWYARWLAALVPLAITIQFALIGLGIMKDEDSVKAMSRTGDPKEILRGPLYYGIMFVLITLIFWKDSPIGMIALMIMCGGDGVADVIGRRFKSPKLVHSPEKSVAGSLGVFIGGWLMSMIILQIYLAAGVFVSPPRGFLLPVALIALVATVFESLPQHDIDNITVTLAATVMGYLLLGG